MSTATTATPNPTEALIASRIDFPTWLPAMLVKELRQGLRERGFVGALIGFQVIMTLFLVFAIAGGSGSASFSILQGAFWVVLNVQLLIITPLRALSGLQAELDSRWVDLLMLTRLTAWRIVVGKWISLLVQGALLLVAMLPYGVARYFFGSIDLVGEAKLILLIFAGSAMLTAAALWSSVLPKLGRVVIGIAVVFIWQAVPASLSSMFSGRPMGMASGPMAGLTGPTWWLILFNSSLLLVVCLTGAVRRLSPKAESQTALTRLMPLLGVLFLPFLSMRNMAFQAVMTAILFTFVAALELARDDEPMECHWREWTRRGLFGRLIARFVQPGWASAIEWVIVVAGAVAIAGLGTPQPWKVALLALHGAAALVFPVLLLTWMSRAFTQRLAGYCLILLGASVLSAVAVAMGSAGMASTVTDRIVQVLPISSFWATLRLMVPPPTMVLVPQVLIAFAVLGMTCWRARAYRMQRAVFEQQPTEDPAP